MCLCLCVCVYAYVHVSACICTLVILCVVQGPEVAVLDEWGGRTPGGVRSMHSRGESLGPWGIPQK